jgi:hypothetical protein
MRGKDRKINRVIREREREREGKRGTDREKNKKKEFVEQKIVCVCYR